MFSNHQHQMIGAIFIYLTLQNGSKPQKFTGTVPALHIQRPRGNNT